MLALRHTLKFKLNYPWICIYILCAVSWLLLSVIIVTLFLHRHTFTRLSLEVPDDVQKSKPRDRHWTNINKNKFLIFIHFHKAGGTSLVDAATSTTHVFDPSVNGIPKRRVGEWRHSSWSLETIPFWEYNTSMMARFIETCKTRRLTFVAMENTYFHHNLINSAHFKLEHNIEVITQIRNPFARFVSNFFFEITMGRYVESEGTRGKDIVQRLISFHHLEGINNGLFPCVSSWNMYVRILTLKCDEPRAVNGSDLTIAKQELDTFEVITILDRPETFKILNIKYGIKLEHSNKLDEANKNINNKDSALLTEFEKIFEQDNSYDYKLYRYAVDKSMRLLNQIES